MASQTLLFGVTDPQACNVAGQQKHKGAEANRTRGKAQHPGKSKLGRFDLRCACRVRQLVAREPGPRGAASPRSLPVPELCPSIPFLSSRPRRNSELEEFSSFASFCNIATHLCSQLSDAMRGFATARNGEQSVRASSRSDGSLRSPRLDRERRRGLVIPGRIGHVLY